MKPITIELLERSQLYRNQQNSRGKLSSNCQKNEPEKLRFS
jgi:hypothetical protein